MAHNTTQVIHEHPVVLLARAKINLCLDVLGRRPDGYHELDTIFQRLSLHDTIVLQPAEDSLTLVCKAGTLPAGPDNIALRAAMVLRDEYGVKRGVTIHLHKRIPVAAGLGGGSADAAAVLRGLPLFWRLPALPLDRLSALARVLGADVPFCLDGSTARARGIGDILTPLPDFTGYEVVLVKPQAGLSTARVYGRFDLYAAARPGVEAAVEAIRRHDLWALGRATGNVLEAPATAMAPEIIQIKSVLRAAGAPVVLMSGSGPAVFALSGEKGWARRTVRALAGSGWQAIATRTD